MRKPRRYQTWPQGVQYFHVISRVVDRRYIFGEREKEEFYKLMRSLELFSGCEVVSFCIMDNHFHILLKVPPKPTEISNDEIWQRMKNIYSKEKLTQIAGKLAKWKLDGNNECIDLFYQGMRNRMYDLSQFVKDLKQRFTIWYNNQNNRKGTLWEERFKSLLIEGDSHALIPLIAYIDLNPVRAGIVSSPDLYKWSGFGMIKQLEDYKALSRFELCLKGIQWLSDDKDGFIKKYEEYLSWKIKSSSSRTASSKSSHDSKITLIEKSSLLTRRSCFSNGWALGRLDYVKQQFKFLFQKGVLKNVRSTFPAVSNEFKHLFYHHKCQNE